MQLIEFVNLLDYYALDNSTLYFKTKLKFSFSSNDFNETLDVGDFYTLLDYSPKKLPSLEIGKSDIENFL